MLTLGTIALMMLLAGVLLAASEPLQRLAHRARQRHGRERS